jgi:hypothetical protein
MKVGFEPGSAQEAIDAAWTKERYHQPSDDLQQPVDLEAAVTFTRLVEALTTGVANHPERARWKPNSVFRRFATHREEVGIRAKSDAPCVPFSLAADCTSRWSAQIHLPSTGEPAEDENSTHDAEMPRSSPVT